MEEKDTLSAIQAGITAEGLEVEFSPVIRAFSTALLDWWRQRTDMEGVMVEARAGARSLLVQRVQDIAELSPGLRVQVEPDELLVRGTTLCCDVPGEYPLARHLYGLGIRRLTLEAGLSGVGFVRFLELCESEPVGHGLGELLREAIPDHLAILVEEVEPLPPEVAPPREESPESEVAGEADEAEGSPVDAVVDPLPEAVVEPVCPTLAALDDMFARMQAEPTRERREGIVQEVFDLLLEVATRNDDAECGRVVAKVSELGNQLVIRSKLGTWVAFVRSLHGAVVSRHSLGATRVCQEILDQLGSTRQILCVLQQYDSDTPPDLSLIAAYMSMVPATALVSVSRCDYWFQTAQLRRLLLRFLREAGPNHPQGIVELARDEDFGFAILAVDVMPDLSPAVATDVLRAALEHGDERVRSDGLAQAKCLPVECQVAALPVALNDASAEIRQAAVRCLGECGTQEAVALLLAALRKPAFARGEIDEKLTMYRSLAISGRPEALCKVEGALIPRARSFVEKWRARVTRARLDPLRQGLLEELSRIDRPQIREILRRAARAGDPALARAVKALPGEE